MNTQQVAHRLVEMCRQGQNLEAIDELYGEHILSQEMPGIPNASVQGIDNVRKKSQDWLASVEQFHSSEVSEPVVAGDHFTIKMDFDVTFKERGRQKMEEVCVFKVNEGKIVSEQFFYDLPEM